MHLNQHPGPGYTVIAHRLALILITLLLSAPGSGQTPVAASDTPRAGVSPPLLAIAPTTVAQSPLDAPSPGHTLNQAAMARSSPADFNPPFPRIGVITFYPMLIPEVIWQDFDLVIIRYYYPEAARKIKEANPKAIVLATNDDITSPAGAFPEPWYLRNADGSLHGRKNAYWMDITNYSPKLDLGYGPQRFNEYFPRFLVENTDWRYFDGIFFDYWANKVWSDADKVDLDRDGRPEGKDAVNAAWEEGNRSLIENLRALTDVPILAHEAGQIYLNGNGFEFWSNTSNQSAKTYRLNKCFSLRENAVRPVINFAEGDRGGATFRADLTSAMLCDAFYGHDEGTAFHRWTFFHDEYEANLGYPTGQPVELEKGLWVRYFDHGLVISNISGEPKTVSAAQLQGGPYWRFRGNQEPQVNDGAQFTSMAFGPYDGILLFKQPTTLVTPIVIDNVEKNMTSLGQQPVQYQGSWTQSKEGEVPYSLGYRWDEYGYYHAYAPPGRGESTATYRPYFGLAGYYEVFEWHGRLGDPPGAGAVASNVPYTIHHADGVTTGSIDQTQNVGRWNSLGIYRFEAGDAGYLQLSNATDGYVISDAVRFVWRGDMPAPTFADVPFDHPYYAEIEALYRAGFTKGCATNPLQYCPEQGLKRAEMAVFMERAHHGAEIIPPQPDPQSLTFADVPSSHWAVEWIEALWTDGYTDGCQAQPQRLFCPQVPHSRAEATVFGLRMAHGRDYTPPPAEPRLADVDPTAWYFDWVHAAYQQGLLPPCQEGPPPRFCPDESLTRALAARMIVRAKGLE